MMNCMQTLSCTVARAGLLLALSAALPLHAFDSGSTGADGALTPAANTVVVLPPDGILNYTTVTIPSGVTVTFQRNVTNTPVVLLVSGDATIDGTISVDGQASPGVGSAGDGNPGDDGDPGLGGPGGFAGGLGGTVANPQGGHGLGPGGGAQATARHITQSLNTIGCGGGGGGFGTNGGAGRNSQANSFCLARAGSGGPNYGNSQLSPLIGGSGGGGGYAGTTLNGSGGGGGGGAILIAASGTVTINGAINARGGASGATLGAGGANYGGTGGSGSGGAIRIVATTITGNGDINAYGRAAGTVTHTSSAQYGRGGNGGTGRIRLEAETLTRTSPTSPPFTTSTPQTLFVPGLPSLRITEVGGITAPAAPTGNADISLDDTANPNPVTVTFESTGVPTGTTVSLNVIPATGATSTVTSTALTGSEALATASASATIPEGDSVLQASLSFTVVASVGDNLARFAQGERVERVNLIAGIQGSGQIQLTTVSGQTYTWPSAIAALDEAVYLFTDRTLTEP